MPTHKSEEQADKPLPWFRDTIQGPPDYMNAVRQAAMELTYLTFRSLNLKPGSMLSTERVREGVVLPPLFGIERTPLSVGYTACRLEIATPGPDPDHPYDTEELYARVAQLMLESTTGTNSQE